MRPGFDGLLVIDKPSSITSRDAVNRAQRWFPRATRIGHAGTLDPLATGVLVLCVGMATRVVEYVQRMPKVYRAGVTLGATSDTDDAEGTITPAPDRRVPTRDEIEKALDSFLGAIDQVPPSFSAAKVTGRRAYDLARKGKEVSLAPRTVTIDAIEMVSFSYPHLDIIVRCGKGTYIRSVARDLGKQLGCGGYITALRRLEIGCFHAADAVPLDATPLAARKRLLPIAHAVAELPRSVFTEPDVWRLLHGQRIAVPHVETGETAVFDEAGRLIAIAEVVDGLLRPGKVLVGTDAL